MGKNKELKLEKKRNVNDTEGNETETVSLGDETNTVVFVRPPP